MKAALIGLPQSGKSTLFQAVTGIRTDTHAAPTVRHAVVHVPDPRLHVLAGLYRSKKVTEATFEFDDVPGCSLDDAKGQDEWRRLLPAVRQADLLIVVVRDFEESSVPKYRNRVHAQGDFAAVWDEIVFADLDTVSRRIDRLEAQSRKPTKTHELEKRERALLERCMKALETGSPLSTVLTTDEERHLVASFAFLTEKPLVCVRNVSDDRASTAEPVRAEHAAASLALSATIEAELAMLDDEDRPQFLRELGLESPARDRLIKQCYEAGGLISFLTAGPEETRAWTVTKGSTAVEAAGKIHSDFARGFIRAETVAYEDLIEHKDMKGAKAAGKVRKEGKSYVVQDGDVMNILAGV